MTSTQWQELAGSWLRAGRREEQPRGSAWT